MVRRGTVFGLGGHQKLFGDGAGGQSDGDTACLLAQGRGHCKAYDQICEITERVGAGQTALP